MPGSAAGAQFRGMAPQAGLYVQAVDLLSGPYISDVYLQTNASFVLTGDGGDQRGDGEQRLISTI